MNPNEYQELARRTETDQTRSVARMTSTLMSRTKDYEDPQLKPIRLNHAVIGLAGEVGELAGALQKWIYYGKGDLDLTNLKEELGDVMWYVALACNALGFCLSDVMESNIRKLRARYPDKYTDERAATRDLEAERKALEGAMKGGDKRRDWFNMLAAIPPGERTRIEVEELRRYPILGGCCDRFADQQACDCLERARPAPGRTEDYIRLEPKASCIHVYELMDKLPDPLPPGVDRAWFRCRFCGDRRTFGIYPAPGSQGGWSSLNPEAKSAVGDSRSQSQCSHCRGTGMVSDEWCTLSTPCPICSGGPVPGGSGE